MGGQDGLVNVLGVTLGMAAANASARLVLVAGLAAAFTESISMGAVAYTSMVARGEMFKGEQAREYRHIARTPAVERAEIRELYAKKGFSGALLDRIVETITRDKDVWVAVMMAEEHGLSDVTRASSLPSAVIVGLASIVGSTIPIVPFLWWRGLWGAVAAVVVSAAVLFGFGAYKGKVTVGRPTRGGLELGAIGLVAAFAGYAVGHLLGIAPAP